AERARTSRMLQSARGAQRQDAAGEWQDARVANASCSMRVGFFTECYEPIVNGVVASIDTLRDGLTARGVEVTTIAPHFPRFVDASRDVVRIPSLPLPTQTAYRLCVPYLNRGGRARVRGIDIVHA